MGKSWNRLNKLTIKTKRGYENGMVDSSNVLTSIFGTIYKMECFLINGFKKYKRSLFLECKPHIVVKVVQGTIIMIVA